MTTKWKKIAIKIISPFKKSIKWSQYRAFIPTSETKKEHPEYLPHIIPLDDPIMTKKYTWPETEPPDQTNPYWEYSGYSNGYAQYKKQEVSPGIWHWVVDTEIMERIQEYDQHRRDLFWALRSRVLTDTEMAEVASLGDSINIEAMQSYDSTEKIRQLNEALLQQSLLRTLQKGAV